MNTVKLSNISIAEFKEFDSQGILRMVLESQKEKVTFGI